MSDTIEEALKIGSISIKDFIEKFKQDGLDIKQKISLFWDLIKSVVFFVEEFTEAVNTEVDEARIKGESKRDLAVRIINENVDIPFVPEFLEETILKFAIDKVVGKFNKDGVFKKD